ncbi:MAG: SLC13/DASS family transporter [Chromatiales bacterium]|nr:SLC13/DASS family transporter [Chromatiales bacterium]
MTFRDRLLLLAGPAVALGGALAGQAGGLAPAAAVTLGITLWCALWWMTEPVAIPVTALLPLALLPMAGVLTPVQVAQAYGNELILLLAGGFMLSTAMERSGAHRRLALYMIRLLGRDSGRGLVFGFTAAAGGLSMWISNTATTLMLLPIALAILHNHRDRALLAAPLVLAVAYGANIGGLGTPIGTPPNLIFMQVYEQATGTRIGFIEWMRWGVPILLLFLPLAALWLARGLGDVAMTELPDPGPWRSAERRVLAVFALVALAWITRTEPFGGWSGLFGLEGANDAAVALLGVVLLCVLPDRHGERLLDWDNCARIPWGALVLFGGGIAIASAFTASGLSDVLAAQLGVLQGLPVLLVIVLICAGMIFLTELTSNTASAALVMPILAAAAIAGGVDPALFMLPAALAATCAFMLPVGTAPNAIAYGSGEVPARRMLREGLVLNALGVVVLSGACWLLLG